MPSDLEQIQTIRQQSLAQLASLRATPKPSYTIDGQQVNWESYVRSLQATIDWCDVKLNDDQPFEQHTVGYT